MKKLILAVMLFIFVGFAYADLYTQLQDVFNFNSSTISSYKGVTFNTLPVNVGNSFHYNGTNFTGANYIKYPNGNIGALTTGTLSMWINLYALTGQQRLLQEASSSTGYELYLQTGAPSLYNGGLVNSPVTLPLNAWGLLTYTWNTTESHIYYNTTIILNTTAISFDFSSNSLLIGTYKTEATGFLLGQLDEIYIWNRTLNYSDVVLLYNSGNGTPSFFPFPISEAPPPPYYINLTANFTAPTPANNSIVDLALTPKVINISCNYTSDAGIYFNATKILNMTSTKFVNWTITPQYGNGTFLYYGFCNSSVTETRTITTFITPTYTALFTEQPANNSFLMPIITPIKLNLSCSPASNASIIFNNLTVINSAEKINYLNWTITSQFYNGSYLYYGLCNTTKTNEYIINAVLPTSETTDSAELNFVLIFILIFELAFWFFTFKYIRSAAFILLCGFVAFISGLAYFYILPTLQHLNMIIAVFHACLGFIFFAIAVATSKQT